MIKKVVVFGSAVTKNDTLEYKLGSDIGSYIAQNKFDVVSGGYFGIMEAVSKGASESNGNVIGVTSKIFVEGHPNKYVTEEIKTDNYWERVRTLIEIGDLFIALNGSTGTLVEVALALEMVNKAFKEKFVFLQNFWKPVIEHLKKDLVEFDPRFPDRKTLKYIQFFEDFGELKKLFEEYIL